MEGKQNKGKSEIKAHSHGDHKQRVGNLLRWSYFLRFDKLNGLVERILKCRENENGRDGKKAWGCGCWFVVVY
ncbi:hypothetical protein EYC84_007277 [Monilinia fructicola]|uniref:Uncharacterized protein n=1 Tax=Monilinia fructicola TaxID=38448 RepID=A0A5M9KAM8_MONFR|nr:hypothetical protein EYC84_007277 [Monilinia fructicola]